MFELAVIGICTCVGYTLYSIVEYVVNEIRDWYAGHSK